MGPTYKYTYRTMPKSTAYTEGMQMLEGDTDSKRVLLAGDVVYATKDGRDLHLRILRPQSVDGPDDNTVYPVLMHVQGSGYLKQNMNDHLEDLKEIAAAGYVVAVIEYRDSTIVKMPGQVYDVKDAARYVAAHAEELRVDASRMYLSGDSSGGHAALMSWATWPVSGLVDEGQGELPAICAFMDFYGCVEFVELLKQESALDHSGAFSAEGFALGVPAGTPEAMERSIECSVLTYVKPEVNNAPLLVLHGNKDRTVPFEQSVMLYEAAKQAGKDVTFYCVNNADHGGSAFYCKAVHDTIINFLNTH